MGRNNRQNDDAGKGPAQSMPVQIAQSLFSEWTCENLVDGGVPCGDINHCTRQKCGGCKGLRSTEEMWAQPPQSQVPPPVQGNYTGNPQMSQMGYAVPAGGMHTAPGQYPAQVVQFPQQQQPMYAAGPVQQGMPMQPMMMQQQPQQMASMQPMMMQQQPQQMASMQPMMMQPQMVVPQTHNYGVRPSSDNGSSAGWNSGRSEGQETRVSGMYAFPSEDGRGQWQDGSYVGQDPL